MRTFIKATLLLAMLLATGSLVHAQISVGIVIAAPPPPRAVVVMTERPDPDSVWVGGYWYPVENHYKWHEGYWTRPPYEGAHWVAPRHDGERYHAGYWEETAAVLNTTTTGIRKMAGTTTTMGNTVVRTTTTTSR